MRKIREIAIVTAAAVLMTMCPVNIAGQGSDQNNSKYTAYAAESENAELATATDPVDKNGWYVEDGKKYYYLNGEKVKDRLLDLEEILDGNTYENVYYLNSDGSVFEGGLKRIDGILYYFDSSSETFSGAAISGWKTVSNRKYYFLSDKKAAKGVTIIGTKKYFFGLENNVLQGGLKSTDDGYMYFSKQTGVAETNKVVNGMYFDSEGYAVKNTFVTINNKTYYYGSNYKVVTGTNKIGNYYYYFDSNGAMYKNVWYQTKYGRYYFGTNGRALTGIHRISGYLFCFDDNCRLVKNTWKNVKDRTYYFGSSGKGMTGFRKIGNYYYYFGTNGIMAKNRFVKISGKTYYFGANGRAYKGIKKINGKTYNFSEKYYLVGAIKKIKGKLYLFDERGVLVTKSGWHTSRKGNKYAIKKDGSLYTGYRKFSSGIYYFSKDNGCMYRNKWAYVNGYKFYFGKDGKRLTDVESVIGAQDTYEIKVNKTTNVVTIYAKDGNKGYIIPVKAFVCSGGDSTPLGTFYIPAKWRWLSLVGDCYGQWNTLITYEESILFHSVYYDEVDADTLSVDAYNKLGTTCSHGCIRLKAGDAKWIYDNCSLGTKITIFESNAEGPFPKPSFVKLGKNHTWDPTDPNMAYKCKARGCHKGIAW